MSDFPPAARVARIAPFQVMEHVKRAVALERQGRSIIHLSIGEPDFTAPEPVVAALERAARDGRTQYTAALGIAPLREAIAADYLDRYRVQIDPARIVVTAGASAALTLACCALVDAGAEVLLTDPGYPCNRHFVAAFDGVARGVPVHADTRFQMTAELLERHWSHRTRGTLLASPANPTGTSIPFGELERIVGAVRARGGFAIVDEIYLGLSYDPTARSALAIGDDLVIANSFSKTYQMTGWRLGWLVVPPRLVPVFEKLAQNLFICASALAQHAALACFDEASRAVYRHRLGVLRERRDHVVPAMRALGFDVPVVPDGAFYAWLDCRRFGDSNALANRLLEQAGVSLVPGHDFGDNDPSRWMRLSYATPIESLREAVSRIGRALG
jgi:aspartate/methionine/tyrosine aminotransferase